MTDKIIGTPDTNEVLDLIAAAIKGYKAAAADGKLDFLDVGHLVPVLMAVGPAAQDIGDVIPELKDLDAAEGQALIAKVASLSGETGPKVRLVLEGLMQMSAGGFKIYSAFKAA